MPITNGPYRDPEEDAAPSGRKPPKALVRMLREFTYEQRLATFRDVFAREPESGEELDAFADEYIRELYNSGEDTI